MTINAELVENAKRGDPLAFTSLYDLTYKSAYGVCFQLVKNADDACDILQDSYITAFTKLNTLEDNEKFQGWFNRIVANNCKNFLKKKRPTLFSEISITDEDGEELEPEFEDVSGDFSPDKNLDYEETKAVIQEVIEMLPEEQRMCILMHYVQEMSVIEISDVLNVSQNTVKSRLNYGRKKMKTELEERKKKGIVVYGISSLAIIPFLRWMFAETTASNPPNVLPKVLSATSNVNETPISVSVNEKPSENADSVNFVKKSNINKKSILSSAATKIGAAVVAIAVVGTGMISTVNNKQKVNIENYFEETINAIGCNGYGRVYDVESVINTDELEKALCGSNENIEEYKLYCLTYNVDINEFITISIDDTKNANLSNGDEVLVDVQVDYDGINRLDFFEKDLNEDALFSVVCKVRGLTDSKHIDLFSIIKEINIDTSDKNDPLKIEFIENTNSIDFGLCVVSWNRQSSHQVLYTISYNNIKGIPKMEFITMNFEMPSETECVPGAKIIATLQLATDTLTDAKFILETTEKDFQIKNVLMRFGDKLGDNINEKSYQIIRDKTMTRAETRFGKGIILVDSRIIRIDGQNPCVAIFFYNESSKKYFSYEYANFLIDYEFNVYQPGKLEPVLYEVQQICETEATVTLKKRNLQTGVQNTVEIQKIQ